MTAGIILLMVVVSGLIRYVYDSRSSHAATALATMVSTTATVRRVGAGERQIPSEELVVGNDMNPALPSIYFTFSVL